jgi:signal transduction histidine kinase/ligand-binding sensor domain-containing protein
LSTILARFPLLSLAIVLIAAVSSQWAMAQTAPSGTQPIVHESWTFKDGAPQESTAFAQTTDGYLWVGAPEGLFRFDGVRFELFRSPSGEQLQSTNVSALFAADDRLWVGYVFGGFSYLKNGRVKNFVENTGTVNGFARDARGITWAGALSAAGRSGLWRFDGSSWQQIGADWNVPSLPVVQVGFDRDGILWVLSGVRGPESPKQLHFLAPAERQFRKAGDNLFVSSFTWDADNYVVSTRERARTEPGSSIELESSLPAYPILKKHSDQILDRAKGIWFIPNQGGMVLRHPAGEPLAEIISAVSPGNSEVVQIDPLEHAKLVDREGSIWFGTENGVHRFSYSPLIQQELPKGPAPWFTLAPDEGGVVWISAGGGAGTSALYRVADGKVDLQKSIAGVSRFAYRAPDKTLWFGGEGGLWRLAGGNLAKVDLPKEMAGRARSLLTMTHDGSGGFWVSFGGPGLYRLRDGEWTKYVGRREPPGSGASTACPRSGVVIAFTDTLARVWLGCTKSQLTVLDADREQTFGPSDGVQVGNVTAIHGRGAEIWIGGEFGLQQFHHGRFHTLRTIDNEALRGISGIVETANGDLWLNGLGGIVHIRRAELLEGLKNPAYQVRAERFDRRAGLPGLPSQLSRAPTAIEGTDGLLWFPVTGGVVWLDPTRASNRTPPPPVSIRSVSADDKVYGLDELPSFPAGTSNVQISYAAVSLLNAEAIRFRYRLQGADVEWHDAGRSTSVSYRNLPPGSYRFQVGASDANGVWSDKIATAEFAILPAYYQTHWFRALCALLLLLLAWVGYQLRIRRLHRQFEMTLEARVAERTRIARDLHDTLLQSFHGLLLRFQTASNLLPDRPAESKQVLASAIDQAVEAITEGRDAVQGLRTSATETNDLVDSLRALAEDLANENGNAASLHIEVQGTPRALHPIVRDEVFRIASEALRNAFRHAGAKRIEVELRYDARHLRVRIRDDGKGIDPEVLRAGGREGHFGLGGMRERAKLAGGKLTVWSGLDAGTEVELSIPGPRAYSSPSPGRSWLAQRMLGQSEISDS